MPPSWNFWTGERRSARADVAPALRLALDNPRSSGPARWLETFDSERPVISTNSPTLTRVLLRQCGVGSAVYSPVPRAREPLKSACASSPPGLHS